MGGQLEVSYTVRLELQGLTIQINLAKHSELKMNSTPNSVATIGTFLVSLSPDSTPIDFSQYPHLFSTPISLPMRSPVVSPPPTALQSLQDEEEVVDFFDCPVKRRRTEHGVTTSIVLRPDVVPVIGLTNPFKTAMTQHLPTALEIIRTTIAEPTLVAMLILLRNKDPMPEAVELRDAIDYFMEEVEVEMRIKTTLMDVTSFGKHFVCGEHNYFFEQHRQFDFLFAHLVETYKKLEPLENNVSPGTLMKWMREYLNANLKKQAALVYFIIHYRMERHSDLLCTRKRRERLQREYKDELYPYDE